MAHFNTTQLTVYQAPNHPQLSKTENKKIYKKLLVY